MYDSSFLISSGELTESNALLISEDNTPTTCLLSRLIFHFSTSLSNVASHPLFFFVSIGCQAVAKFKTIIHSENCLPINFSNSLSA